MKCLEKSSNIVLKGLLQYCYPALLAMGLLFTSLNAVASVPIWDFSVEAGYDDNVMNAVDDADVQHSRFLAAAADVSFQQRWLPRVGSFIGLQVDAQHMEDLDALSSGSVAMQAGLWYSLGRGFSAPTLGLDVSAGWREFRSDGRDHQFQRLRLGLNQRWTTQVSAGADLQYAQQRARDAVHDTQQISIAGHLDWAFLAELHAYTNLQWRWGEVTASARPPNAALVQAAQRIVLDDAASGFMAYRLEANTAALSLGLNARIAASAALDWQIRYIESSADGEVEYQRWQTRFGLLLQY